MSTKSRFVEHKTRDDEVDLGSYNSLDITFKNARGAELFNVQFRRGSDGSAELAVNIIGLSGEVSTAVTLFDLPV